MLVQFVHERLPRRVPVQEDADYRCDARQVFHQFRFNGRERFHGAGFDTSQDVEDLVEIRQAAARGEMVQVRPRGEDVHQILLARHVIAHRRADRHGAFERLAGSGRPGEPPRHVSVEDHGDAQEVLLAVLAHDGRVKPRGGPPVNVADTVAFAVFAIAGIFERVADVGGQRDAAGLEAAARGEAKPRQRREFWDRRSAAVPAPQAGERARGQKERRFQPGNRANGTRRGGDSGAPDARGLSLLRASGGRATPSSGSCIHFARQAVRQDRQAGAARAALVQLLRSPQATFHPRRCVPHGALAAAPAAATPAGRATPRPRDRRHRQRRRKVCKCSEKLP